MDAKEIKLHLDSLQVERDGAALYLALAAAEKDASLCVSRKTALGARASMRRASKCVSLPK